MKNKDELSKYICKNEKQLLKKIKSGAKVIMCYNFNINWNSYSIWSSKRKSNASWT